MFTLLFLIFSRILGSQIPHYPLYLLLGIIIFNFFRNATLDNCRAIYDHRMLIKSISFPLEALIGANILKTLYSHLFEILVFTGFLFFYSIPIIKILYYIPILLCFILFLYGLSLCLSASTIFFMDLHNIWQFFAQLLWFATPIFYKPEPTSMLQILNLCNPMYYFITASRDLMVYTKAPNIEIIIGIIMSGLISFLLGISLFNRTKTKFTELL